MEEDDPLVVVIEVLGLAAVSGFVGAVASSWIDRENERLERKESEKFGCPRR